MACIRQIRILFILLLFGGLFAPVFADVKEESTVRRVMAFYYPWYGIAEGPGGVLYTCGGKPAACFEEASLCGGAGPAMEAVCQ